MHSRNSLARDARALGVRPGDLLMVHASVRAVGPVVGGPDRAFLERFGHGRAPIGDAPTVLIDAQPLLEFAVRVLTGLADGSIAPDLHDLPRANQTEPRPCPVRSKRTTVRASTPSQRLDTRAAP